MEFQHKVQNPGGEGNQDKGTSSHYLSYRRTIEPDRAYSDTFRLTRSRLAQLSSAFTPFRKQQISDQESPLFKLQVVSSRRQGYKAKKDFFKKQAERVRPNNPEAVGLGERSTQEPEIFVNTSKISSPINRNITPTQNEHNVVKPESNLKSDQLWLQMSQFAVKNQEKFDELHWSNVRLQEFSTSQEATIKDIQERCATLSKASEETN
ncbi:hypothetical protein O181_109172 [Austropuccinia psidii MF-1]|uniref:Uncharacterized protein n=1 Tax=Austropuccinia psidii MF-1 TaxID=1389203 RepID=A0A9Q3JVM2_9BASI|nr:hypothetical protein [Austropuccinia psidii MF-1]